MSFKGYGKIHRIGKDETFGLFDGVCTIQEKVDGANLSIWYDEDEGIQVGSRTQNVTLGSFRGAVEYVMANDGIKNYLSFLPSHRLYGEWLCLSGDTIIRKVSGGRGGKGNFMTLKEMYEYLHNSSEGRVKSWWERFGMPSIYSLFQDKDLILPNKIKNITKSGEKEVFEVTTREGKTIKASATHPFLTQYGFIKLEEIIKEPSKYVLAISDLIVDKKPRRLGVGSRKTKAAQDNFKKEIGSCKICGNTTSLELDHIDEDWKNNNEDNWQVLCRDCHAIKSGNFKRTPAHTKGYSYRFDKIVSIISKGIEETYDITMEGEENEANFVAQDFIVHNCPHTITSYNAENYSHFYLFDIEDEDGKRLPQSYVKETALQYGIRTPHTFAVITNPTIDNIMELVGKSTLGPIGEGVVVKNESFINKYGDKCYGKIVSDEFKEDNAIVFGNAASDDNEMKLVSKYVTIERIRKIMNKIEQNEDKDIDRKDMAKIIGMTSYDFLQEEFQSIAKCGIVNFNRLSKLSTKKIARIALDIIDGNQVSVAFNQE